MSLLKSLEFIPGIKWFESEMHNSLFQHSVFGAIVFLIVSNTGVYKLVKDTIFQCCGIKVDGNTLQLVHAVVFMVIMYFGSMYLFAPLLGEGMPKMKGMEGLVNPTVGNPDTPTGGTFNLTVGNPDTPTCSDCRDELVEFTNAAQAKGVNTLLSLLASEAYQTDATKCSRRCEAEGVSAP
tara:strand:+ start:1121 stop:1660 length:540 start_codon:yes stop_codon:yes gene_type:complete